MMKRYAAVTDPTLRAAAEAVSGSELPRERSAKQGEAGLHEVAADGRRSDTVPEDTPLNFRPVFT